MSGNNLKLQFQILVIISRKNFLKKYKESYNSISRIKEDRPVTGFTQ